MPAAGLGGEPPSLPFAVLVVIAATAGFGGGNFCLIDGQHRSSTGRTKGLERWD